MTPRIERPKTAHLQPIDFTPFFQLSLASLLALGGAFSGCATLNGLLADAATGASRSASSNGFSSSTQLAAAGSSSALTTNTLPAFCEGKSYAKVNPGDLQARFADPIERADADLLAQVHRGLCAAEALSTDRQQLEQMRFELVRDLGLTDFDLRDVKALMDHSYSTGALPGILEQKQLPAGVPQQQAELLRRAAWDFYAVRWWVDAYGADLSQTARLYWLGQCLSQTRNATSDARKAVTWAGCNEDLKRLDRAALRKESAPGQPAYRLVAQIEAVEIQRKAAQFETELKKKPAYARRALELPKATFDRWQTLEKTNATLFQAARKAELESMQDRDGQDEVTAPCDATLVKQFEGLARVAKPARDGTRLAVGDSSLTYVAGVGMRACLSMVKAEQARATAIGAELARASWRRGPHTELLEVLQHSFEGEVDPLPRQEASFEKSVGISRYTPGRGGIVNAVVHKGAMVRIEFSKEPFFADVCEQTAPSRTRWEWRDAKFQPVQECTRWSTRQFHETIDPLDIPKSQATQVSPGRLLTVQRLGSQQPGAVLEVWDGKAKNKLLALYGVQR